MLGQSASCSGQIGGEIFAGMCRKKAVAKLRERFRLTQSDFLAEKAQGRHISARYTKEIIVMTTRKPVRVRLAAGRST